MKKLQVENSEALHYQLYIYLYTTGTQLSRGGLVSWTGVHVF